jgi:hypothetical protein
MDVQWQVMTLGHVEQRLQLFAQRRVAVHESTERRGTAGCGHGNLAGDALRRRRIRPLVERHQGRHLQVDPSAPLLPQLFEHAQRHRHVVAGPVQVGAHCARAAGPGILQGAQHAQAQVGRGPGHAVRRTARNRRHQVALGGACGAHGVGLVQMHMGIDETAEQRAACGLGAGRDADHVAGLDPEVEGLVRRKIGIGAAHAGRYPHRLQSHGRLLHACSGAAPPSLESLAMRASYLSVPACGTMTAPC